MQKIIKIISFISFPYITLSAMKWDAKKYYLHHAPQRDTALTMLAKVDLTDKTVLDVGCGPGDITSEMLNRGAMFVTGIDACPNMIDKAQELYGAKENIEFIHVPAEVFCPFEKYNLVTSFYCLHWILDIEKLNTIFSNFFYALKDYGEVLFTIDTTKEGSNIFLEAFENILSDLQLFSIQEPLQGTILVGEPLSSEQLVRLLEINGLQALSIEHQNHPIRFTNKEDFANWVQPMVTPVPYVANLPSDQQELLLNLYINKLWNMLEPDEDYKIYHLKTAVVHAKKFRLKNI